MMVKEVGEDDILKNFDVDYSKYSPEYTPNRAIFIAKLEEYLEQKHFFLEKNLLLIKWRNFLH